MGKTMSIRDRILLALPVRETGAAMTVAEIAAATGLRNSQVSGALTPLKNAGIVVNKDGRWSLAEHRANENVARDDGMMFEAIGFTSDGTMLVRDVTDHKVYSIAPV